MPIAHQNLTQAAVGARRRGKSRRRDASAAVDETRFRMSRRRRARASRWCQRVPREPLRVWASAGRESPPRRGAPSAENPTCAAGWERHQRTSAVPREFPGTDDVRRAPCCRVDRSDSPDTLAVLWRTWLSPNSGCSRKRRGSARRRERRPRRRATFPSASASAVMIRASTRSGAAQRSRTRLVQSGISVNAVRRSSASARHSLVQVGRAGRAGYSTLSWGGEQ